MAERREYFRIDAEVLVEYAVVPAQGLEAALERFRRGVPDRFTLAAHFAATTRQIETLHKRIAAENPDVAHYLAALDHKLDILARLMLKGDQPGRGAEVVRADLSATGIGFGSREAVATGALLDMRIMLMPDYLGLEMIGRVVRCEPGGSGDDHAYHLAVDFEHIREADREQIIEHVLARQTAMLRRRGTGSAQA